LNSYLNILVTNAIVLIGVFLLVAKLLIPFLDQHLENNIFRNILTLFLGLAIAFPFLWALMAKRPRNFAYKELWMIEKYNRGPLFVLEAFRILAGVTFIIVLTFKLFPTVEAMFVTVPLVTIVLVVFKKRIQQFYSRLELRFMGNLNARENADLNSLDANVMRKNAAIQSGLQPWDAHIVQLQVPRDAAYTGKPLWELSWREKFGVNIAYIKRGEKIITNPARHDFLIPYDDIGVIGTDDQMQNFKPVFQPVIPTRNTVHRLDDIVLHKIIVDEHSKLNGLDIRTSKIREYTEGLVIGVERNNQRILNPESTLVFEWNDVIWIVGNKEKIQDAARGYRKEGE
jgi:monovalent cation:H+ antiporter-2, CPA2 family